MLDVWFCMTNSLDLSLDGLIRNDKHLSGKRDRGGGRGRGKGGRRGVDGVGCNH